MRGADVIGYHWAPRCSPPARNVLILIQPLFYTTAPYCIPELHIQYVSSMSLSLHPVKKMQRTKDTNVLINLTQFSIQKSKLPTAVYCFVCFNASVNIFKNINLAWLTLIKYFLSVTYKCVVIFCKGLLIYSLSQ